MENDNAKHMGYRFSGECPDLVPTERDQNRASRLGIGKAPHRCKKYLTRLTHGRFHPNIMCCMECIQDKSYLRKECNYGRKTD